MTCRHVTLGIASSCQRRSSLRVAPIRPRRSHPISYDQCCRAFAAASSFPSPAAAAAEITREAAERWQLFASVIVERPRIVTKRVTEIEEEYQLILEDYEHEKALKSDHEMRIEQDIRNQERKRKGLEVLNEPLQTGFEFEEDREKLRANFRPASRASKSDDLRSLDRVMDEKLYLLVPHLLGPGNDWFLPSSPVEGKISLREAVDEALAKTFAQNHQALEKIQALGNAPFGFYKYRYPMKSEEAGRFRGGKFFLFKAFLKDPRTFSMEEDAETRKFAWVTKAELKRHLHPALNSKVRRCLFDY